MYAKWSPNVYTITFNSNGGTACDPTTVVYGDEYGALPTPTRTGYSFAGWMYNGEIVTATTTMTTGNHTLVAQWTGNPYTVTFDSNGGSECADITVTFGSTYGQLPTSTKENSQLEGWYLGDIKIEPSTVVSTAENHTLVARWTEITDWITVTFIDGSTTLETRQYGTNENGDIPYGTLPNPTKVGYNFVGWYADSGLSTAVTTATLAGKEDHNLYAKWQIISYTVSFVDNVLNTAFDVQIVDYGGIATAPTMPAVTGYTFGGWYTDGAWNQPFDFSTPITSDVTLYAKFTINTYTVTFNANGHGTAPPAQTINHGQQATKPNDLTADKCLFGGWYIDSACTTAFDFSTPITGNITLYAKWTELCTVTINVSSSNSPTWTNSITITSGRVVSGSTTYNQSGTWTIVVEKGTVFTINAKATIRGTLSSYTGNKSATKTINADTTISISASRSWTTVTVTIS